MEKSGVMDWGSFVFLAIVFSGMFFLIQRTEAKRRRLVIYLMAFVAFLTVYWANFRGLNGPLIAGIITAIILNYLFWLMIGRYNPVGDSDNIQVIGMDD